MSLECYSAKIPRSKTSQVKWHYHLYTDWLHLSHNGSLMYCLNMRRPPLSEALGGSSRQSFFKFWAICTSSSTLHWPHRVISSFVMQVIINSQDESHQQHDSAMAYSRSQPDIACADNDVCIWRLMLLSDSKLDWRCSSNLCRWQSKLNLALLTPETIYKTSAYVKLTMWWLCCRLEMLQIISWDRRQWWIWLSPSQHLIHW